MAQRREVSTVPVGTGAGFEFAEVGTTAPRDAAVLVQIGAANAFRMMSAWSTAQYALTLRSIKDEGIYLQVASTWEDFCERYLPISRRTADEDIHFLEVLGQEFLAAAEQIGLGRRQLRRLASVPADLLPRPDGDVIVIGDERVPLKDKSRVVELLETLLAQNEDLQDRIKDGEQQLSKKDEKLRATKSELKELQDVAAGRITSEFDRLTTKALRLLSEAGRYLSDTNPAERPAPKAVLAYSRAFSEQLSDWIHYGGQYATPDWARDPGAMRRHMQEREDALSDELIDDEMPPASVVEEMRRSLGKSGWGDEDKLL